MAESSAETTTDAVSKRPTSKRGVPRIDLQSAETSAKALWDVARNGSTSETALARQLSGPTAKASGGRWRTRVGSLGYFGLVESPAPSQLKLSEIGLRIVRETEPEVVLTARKDAVLSVKPYQEILQKSVGHELPATPGIVGTFQFDYSLNEADAKKAADHFESSVKLAGLVGDDGKVTLTGVSVSPQEPSDDDDSVDTNDTDQPDTLDGTSDEPDRPAGETDDMPPNPSAGSDSAKHLMQEERKSPATPTKRDQAPAPDAVVRSLAQGGAVTSDVQGGVSIRIRLDMTHWQADDVVKVLNALGGQLDER